MEVLILKFNDSSSEENYFVSVSSIISSSFNFSRSGDRSFIYEARLQRNFVVQVILNDKSTPPVQSANHIAISVEHQPISTESSS